MAPPARTNTSINNNNNENTEHNVTNNNNNGSICNNTTNSIRLASVTGAVPKTTTTAKRLATLIKQQMQQQQLQQHQERKNTEIVQPLQRELKSLNDFLLASVNRSRLIGVQSQYQQQQQQQQVSNTCTTPRGSYDTIANPQEQPRSFRVRPVQRVRHQQESSARSATCRFQQTPQLQLLSNDNNNANNTTYVSNATIGVVIPTTPNSAVINNSNETNNNTVQPQSSLINQNGNTLVAASRRSVFNGVGIPTIINDILNAPVVDINTLRQQFELVRSVLGLDENWNTSEHSTANATEANKQQQQTPVTPTAPLNMVHEINPKISDVVVNSSSLEDVAASEASDNRAQSIQSLHSILDTPTPDSSPSFEELQERLDSSNRNMQNIQEKQSQLLRLQNAAKEHLDEMEHLRAQTQKLSFASGTSHANGNGAGDGPNYESIAEVQSDMATLVGRMKNLTAFIHNQNELSDILGEDGPEILAEQEALQQKLESLRSQRDDMRNLVDELQSINRTAEQSVKARTDAVNSIDESETGQVLRKAVKEAPAAAGMERAIKTRVVPIEIQKQAASAAERAAAAQAMIIQKNNDIDTLKAQMQRLKDMLSTVNLIEESTASKANERAQSLRSSISSERERTPVAVDQHDENIARKVRALNKVTADLRAEAASLEQERDRIHALKDEIQRRKEQAAAAAQLGEDALMRHSLTPTPTKSCQKAYKLAEQQQERDQLKSEYELKKREFENLCKHLEHECLNNNPPNDSNQNRRGETLSEADDEADDTNDSDFANNKYYGNQQTANEVSLRRQLSSSTVVENEATQKRGLSQHHQQHPHHHQQQQRQQQSQVPNDDESNTAMANSTIDGASLDAASVQSSSARSYFMPPPMPPVGNAWSVPASASIPAAWNSNYFYSVPPPPPTQTASTATNSMPNDFVPTMIGGTAPASSSTSTAAPQVTADPMVLQQIVQTQQMIINSICQTNQTLWHQQREIDSINSLCNSLQERVNNIGGAADLGFSLRSESVPPSAIGSSIPNNNHYLSGNRAQSEQPLQFGVSGGAFANFQQQQHIFQQRLQQQQRAGSLIYNYAADVSQQHNTNAINSAYHATLNNAATTSNITNAAPPPAQQPTHFNNETPMSPHMPNSPGPIFMHHHNNTIHQNNANLRTQNQHANNLQQQQQQQAQAASTVSQPTLNNQVPPGNRANNYWDNFRSYSRQNLLSINSSKSNEDQQQILQDQQQLRHYRAPRHTAYGTSNQTRLHMQRHLYEVPAGRQNLNSLTTTMSNNLNCNNNNNKYMNVMAQQQQHHQRQQQARPLYLPNVGVSNRSLLRDEFYANLERHEDEEIVEDGNGALYRSCSPQPTDETNGHNMNLNYGNSPLFQRNKVSAKSASSATLTQPTSRRSYVATPPFEDYSPGELHEASYNRPLVQRRTRPLVRDAHGYDEPFELPEHRDYNIHEPYAPRPANATTTSMTTNEQSIAENCEPDEASEEINRNLLVNALKNDKFTTKFYESIKEDVFRRLESLFEQHEVENGNRQQQQQRQSQQQQPQTLLPTEAQQATNQLFNDVGPQRDPFRKLNLNQQQQQQKQQQHETISPSMQINVELDAQQLLEEDVNNAETESNKADSETALEVMQHQNEDMVAQNEKPEDEVSVTDEPQMEENISLADSFASNQPQIVVNYGNADTQLLENDNAVEGACSVPQTIPKQQVLENNEKLIVTVLECQSPPPEFEVIPDYELIEYIIKRIRNQTHTNTVINDPLMVEVSKLTANAAQNSATTKLAANAATMPIISPKRIYAKIKKSILSIPRNRDAFLTWYQEYLEGMFLVEQHVPECCTSHTNDKEKLNMQKSNMAASITAHSTVAAFSSSKNRQPLTNGRSCIREQEDDADLAEADQNSASNSINEAADDAAQATGVGLIVKFESDDFENNENPEEEGGTTEGACALALTTTSNDKASASST